MPTLEEYVLRHWNVTMGMAERVGDAVVVADTPALEIAHWTVSVPKLLTKYNVRNVHHVSDRPVQYNINHLIFLLGDYESFSKLRKLIEPWIDSHTVTISVAAFISTSSLRLLSGSNNPPMYYQQTLEHMKSSYPQEIGTSFRVNPMYCFPLSPHTLITPSASKLFPLLPHNLMDIGTWLRSQNDPRSPMGQVLDYTMLPKSLQLYIRAITEDLGGMLDDLGMVEECYSVGRLSRVVANQLVATVNSRPERRTNVERWSVVFVDRTLDLFTGTVLNPETAAELVYGNLEPLYGDSNDVRIPLAQLFNKSEDDFVINGCLADSKGEVPMSELVQQSSEDIVLQILDTLANKLQVDPEILNSGNLREILAEADTFSKYENFEKFQILAAISASQSIADTSKMDSVAGIDQSLFWTALEGSISVPQLANSILAGCPPDKLSLSFTLALLVHLYTFFGDLAVDDTSDFEEIEEARLHDTIFKQLQSDDVGVIRNATNGVPQPETLHNTADDLIRKVKSLSEERAGMSQISSLLTQVSSPSYKSLLERILELSYDTTDDLSDVEYRSGGLRDLLKTGLGLFTRAVAKPRPSGNVLVYVVGGITLKEVAWIEDYRKRTKRNVLLAGNAVLSRQRLLHKLFVLDNAFGV